MERKFLGNLFVAINILALVINTGLLVFQSYHFRRQTLISEEEPIANLTAHIINLSDNDLQDKQLVDALIRDIKESPGPKRKRETAMHVLLAKLKNQELRKHASEKFNIVPIATVSSVGWIYVGNYNYKGNFWVDQTNFLGYIATLDFDYQVMRPENLEGVELSMLVSMNLRETCPKLSGGIDLEDIKKVEMVDKGRRVKVLRIEKDTHPQAPVVSRIWAQIGW